MSRRTDRGRQRGQFVVEQGAEQPADKMKPAEPGAAGLLPQEEEMRCPPANDRGWLIRPTYAGSKIRQRRSANGIRIDRLDGIAGCSTEILPPDIRKGVPARVPRSAAQLLCKIFRCRERQYRYFFTQPGYSPMPSSVQHIVATAPQGRWLDIDAMRKAARLYEGLLISETSARWTQSKRITNFWRRIFECDIVEVKDSGSALPYLGGVDCRRGYAAG